MWLNVAEEIIVRQSPEAQTIILALLEEIAELKTRIEELERREKGKTPQNSSFIGRRGSGSRKFPVALPLPTVRSVMLLRSPKVAPAVVHTSCPFAASPTGSTAAYRT